jgi:prevent-host-death family protein
MLWTVSEAKGKLSQVLRLAREGEPQTVGTIDPCVIISQHDFEELKKPNSKLNRGKALIEAASKLGFEIELPLRNQDHNRPVFED